MDYFWKYYIATDNSMIKGLEERKIHVEIVTIEIVKLLFHLSCIPVILIGSIIQQVMSHLGLTSVDK